jgi:hypothetical protein
MQEIKLTKNRSITEEQMLELRNLTIEEVEILEHKYESSFIYDLLYKEDLLTFEYNEDYDLFMTHTHELFNDFEFNELLKHTENTSESDDFGVTYETQVIY